MVCKLPSARSLSKASREGDLRENMANADMSASVKEMSVSLRRSSRMLAKPLRTKRKSASAERCWRPLGAIIDMATPDMWTSNRFREGGIFALMFTKRQPEWRGGYWGLSLSGNCCHYMLGTENWQRSIQTFAHLSKQKGIALLSTGFIDEEEK